MKTRSVSGLQVCVRNQGSLNEKDLSGPHVGGNVLPDDVAAGPHKTLGKAAGVPGRCVDHACNVSLFTTAATALSEAPFYHSY